MMALSKSDLSNNAVLEHSHVVVQSAKFKIYNNLENAKHYKAAH